MEIFILHPEHVDAVFCAAPPKERMKNVFQSLYVMPDRVVATDAYRLIELKRTPDDNDNNSLLIDAESLHVTRKALKKNTSFIGISPEEGNKLNISILSPNSETRALAIAKNGNFPDYEQIIPTEKPTAFVKLNAKYLKQLAAYIEKHNIDDFNGVILELYGHDKPVMFHATTKNGHKMRSIIMPLRMEEEEIYARQHAEDEQEPVETLRGESENTQADVKVENLPF